MEKSRQETIGERALQALAVIHKVIHKNEEGGPEAAFP
jgi:hypothetical protein